MSCSRIYCFITQILDYSVLGWTVANGTRPGTEVKGMVLMEKEFGPIQIQRSLY